MDNKAWFKTAGFGMMVHFGLYSVLGGEYKGKRLPDRVNNAEWIQHALQIPNKEYEKLKDVFNPIYFNAEEYAALAKSAGMSYIVVTAKHHEGFALFDSKADDFTVMQTPFKRDIVREYADACKKYGLKFGLYYSQEMDWHEKDGGGVTCEWGDWSNFWDFKGEKKDFARCFEKKIKPQVKELLSNYGDIALIWFDNPTDITEEQSKELYDIVKTLQPDCLVNSRIGNGLGDYRSTNDNEFVEDSNVLNKTPDKIDARSSEYLVGTRTGLYECPATMNSSWGWKYYDNDFISAEEIVKKKKKLNALGINYLLNVGPDHLGRIPAPCIDALTKAGRR